MRRMLIAALPLAVAGSLSGCTDGSDDQEPSAAGAVGPAAPSKGFPALRVRTVVGGLDHPWDVQSIGHGRLLVTERDRARLSLVRHGIRRTVAFPSDKVWVSGETGLLGMAVDPSFAQNHRVYLCHGWFRNGGGHDIRVDAWRVDPVARTAHRVKVLLDRFPTSSGRHGGCRLLVTDQGALIVGTGDAAQGSNPRNLTSLGGKTLRLDRFSGRPWPGNTWRHAATRNQRYIHTFGHRNVQGLAQRADGTLWSVEHGSDRDDEVNLLRNGADYGWDPVPGYDESVPMTDPGLPGHQVRARWRSGIPTLATSGATFLPQQRDSRWGAYRGTLAVAALKAERVLFMRFDDAGRLRWVKVPPALTQHGRLRAVSRIPGGDILVTTDNGNGDDKILRVSPSS
jgi:glucose/arabinose dehydrogenase